MAIAAQGEFIQAALVEIRFRLVQPVLGFDRQAGQARGETQNYTGPEACATRT